GEAVTVNDPELVPVPAGLLTATVPVLAPAGTVAVMLESEATVNVAGVPLKLTAVAKVNPLPVIVTDVPTGPEAGASEETDGGEPGTGNDPALAPVPAGLLTATFPERAPAGTVSVKLEPAAPLN